MTSGFDVNENGLRIENIPHTGALTGRYEIDFYGCWWEVNGDDEITFWMIGEYPEEALCQISDL